MSRPDLKWVSRAVGGGCGWESQVWLFKAGGVHGVLRTLPSTKPPAVQGCLSSSRLDSAPNFPEEQVAPPDSFAGFFPQGWI